MEERSEVTVKDAGVLPVHVVHGGGDQLSSGERRAHRPAERVEDRLVRQGFPGAAVRDHGHVPQRPQLPGAGVGAGARWPDDAQDAPISDEVHDGPQRFFLAAPTVGNHKAQRVVPQNAAVVVDFVQSDVCPRSKEVDLFGWTLWRAVARESESDLLGQRTNTPAKPTHPKQTPKLPTSHSWIRN